MSAIALILFGLCFVMLSWYLYYLHCFNYWKKKQIPNPSPQFPGGNILNAMLGKENIFDSVANYYKVFKEQGHRHLGLYFFNGPVYVPIDLEIVKAILTADFEHFMDRGAFVDEENYPLSGHIFSLRGARWKNLRNKMSPIFSSGKLKTIYEIFIKISADFVKCLEPSAQRGDDINIKYISANFTADVILSSAFGLDSNILEEPNGALAQTINDVLNPPDYLFLKTILLNGFQNPGNIVKPILDNKKTEKFFIDLMKDALKHRAEKRVVRKDFLQLMLEIKDKEGLTFNEILAQSFVFFLAGFETSSQTITYCVHELAHNQEIQNKLRKEIIENLGNDVQQFSYEKLLTLPYLDKVINETLRLYPVLGFLNRICVKPYKIPNTNITIEKDTPVLIPALGIQRDPEYFPEPLKFDPERFSEDQAIVPFSFLPFGDGPRFCIGRRFGTLQTKLGVAALISHFKFSPSPKTPKYVEFDKLAKSLGMVPLAGIYVKITKL